MIPAAEIERWSRALLDFHLKAPADSFGPVDIRTIRELPIVSDLVLVMVTVGVYKTDYVLTFRVNAAGGVVSQSIREIMPET